MSAAAKSTPLLAPRLRNVLAGARRDLDISRHVFYGEAAYVLRDRVSGQSHTLSAADYQVFTAITVKAPLGETFAKLCEQGLVTADEEAFYHFIVNLNHRGLLQLPVSDGSQLYARYERRRSARGGGITSLLFWRIPLLRPDAFLTRTASWFAPLFTRAAFVVWSVAMFLGICVVAGRWQEFSDPVAGMLTLRNLPLLWMLLAVLKICHEFGHAYACKLFGGQVPEMGAYLMLCTPCAYVDASAAWGFPRRLHRIIVSAAGMYVESILALAALVVWCATPPSSGLHLTAQYIVILSTVVTVGFNLNPLVKYDGYFILSDLLGAPNLGQRSTASMLAWVKRTLYGIPLPPSIGSHRERAGLLIYGVLSLLYRCLVVAGMVVLIAMTVPIVGLVLGIGFGMSVVVGSFHRLVHFLRHSPELARSRNRAIAVTAGLAGAIPLAIALAPAPGGVQALGVVSMEQDRQLRATTPGFLREWRALPGERVSAGDAVCVLENREVTTALRVQEAEVRRFAAARSAALASDPAAAEEFDKKLRQAELERDRAATNVEELIVRAPIGGWVTAAPHAENTGFFLVEGESVARIGDGAHTIRTLVNSRIFSSRVPQPGDGVEVCQLGDRGRVCAGVISSIGPAGTRRVEQAALTLHGGGDIAVDGQTRQAREPLFDISIRLDGDEASLLPQGATAIVRFSSHSTSIGVSVYRNVLAFLQSWRVAN